MSFQDIPDDPSLSDPLPACPFDIVERWLREAGQSGAGPNPTAMTVATADSNGHPSARVLLCRGVEPDPGYFVFYSNRRSRKGAELRPGAHAAAVFHWDVLRRQIRIEGPVVHSPDSESDAYFATRPRPSQIAAWASDQSEPIESRSALLDRLHQCDRRFADGPIPRPPYWGGYRLYCRLVELWVGAEGRAHDRAQWVRALLRQGDGFSGGNWELSRLQP